MHARTLNFHSVNRTSTRATHRLAMLAAGIVFAVLAGCSRPQNFTGSGDKPAADAARQLAYEHTVSFDAVPERVRAIHAAGLAACRAAGAAACTLLESRIDGDPEPEAALRFRATPQVIPQLVAAMGKEGELARQSTSAEDLSGPIADTARQLAMLKDYRARLEDVRNRAGSDIDALIKVNRELAEVQTKLETADGERALLVQRIETEILNVSIGSKRHRPFWAPIGHALRNFSGQLSEGIAYAISALAYLLPWLFMIALAAWVVRRWWRASPRRGSRQPPRRAPDEAG